MGQESETSYASLERVDHEKGYEKCENRDGNLDSLTKARGERILIDKKEVTIERGSHY